MFKITIPKPCHEDWNAMTPNEQGRYCTAYSKTVTDFSTMSEEAIQQYFIENKNENLCGRFKNEQLSRIVIELPERILYMDLPLWKKFLVACLIVFSTTLFSCDTTIKGEPAIEQQYKKDSIKKLQKLDSMEGYVGGLMIKWDSLTIPNEIIIPETCGITYGFTVPAFINADTVENTNFVIKDSVSIVIADSSKKFSLEPPADNNHILKQDSVKTKNPPKADSLNCDTQIFY